MIATFEILEGGVPGQQFTLDDGERKVAGRATDCDIQLIDRGVSRHHAAFFTEGGQVILEDLGSSNGTSLNGQRITKRSELSDGDLIRIGLAAVRIKIPKERQTSPTAQLSQEDLIIEQEEVFATRVRKHLDMEHSFILSPPEEDEALRRAHRNLAALHRLANDVHSTQDTRILFSHVVDLLRESLGADAVALLLVEPAGRSSLAALNVREGTGSESFSISNSVVDDVISAGVSTLIHDTGERDGIPPATSITGQQIRSIICAPVIAGGVMLGTIYADSRRSTRVFDEVDLELITAAGKQAGLAIQRARLFMDMENLFFSSIRALTNAVDAKDRYTRGHSSRVTAYAVRLARNIGLNEDEVETVQLAGLLHDVGKIAVPERILNKPGPLTDEEYAVVKEHPVRGAEIVSTIKSPDIPAVVQGVLHHHERWDGSGYPDSLKGFDTPLTARVLSVADAFDAMTSDRPYRRGYSIEHAVSFIGEAGGTQFDAELAGHFLELYYAGRLELPSRRVAQYDTSRIELDGEGNDR